MKTPARTTVTAALPYANGPLHIGHIAGAYLPADIYVRGSAKDHGRRNLIEGELVPGQRVLVIEDLISTGGSCLVAVDALRSAGAEVVGVLAIFQYGFAKAAAAFAEKKVPFQTLTNYDVLVEEAARRGYVSAGDLTTLQKWRENPEGWGALYV